MKLTALDDLLWAFGFLGTIAVLAALLRHRRWEQFPIFTAWMAYETAVTVVMFLIYQYGSAHWYVRTYWASLWPDFALQVGVAAELARILFRPTGQWVRDARGILVAVGVGGGIVFALLCWWIRPPHSGFTPWELRADLFTSLTTCELLVAITVVANWLRLGWPNEVLSIIEGLTAWSGVMTLTTALQAYLGDRDFKLLDHVRVYAWIGATIWIAMEFGLPNPNPEFPVPLPAEPSSRAPERVPPGMLRPLAGRLASFQKQARLRSGGIADNLPLPPTAYSANRVQS